MRGYLRFGWLILLGSVLSACPSVTSTKALTRQGALVAKAGTKAQPSDHTKRGALKPVLVSRFVSPIHLPASRKPAPPPTRPAPPTQASTPMEPEPQANQAGTRVAMVLPNERRMRLPAPKPRPLPRPIPHIREIARQFRALGQEVVKGGKVIMWRYHYMRKRCSRSSRGWCRTYRRAAKMFAYNYRTSPRNYRGYMLFHPRNKRRIPRYLKRWYNRLAHQRFKHKPATGNCYLTAGLFSNCMSFAMCSQKRGLRRFKTTPQEPKSTPKRRISKSTKKRPKKRSRRRKRRVKRPKKKKEPRLDFPLWGFVNYWSTEAYDALLTRQDLGDESVYKPGLPELLASFSSLSLEQKQQRSRKMLMSMLDEYMHRIRRSRKLKKHLLPLFENAFCTNIVVSAGDFSRALPGDMFVLTFPRKRRKSRRFPSSYRFQHWGLIVDPEKRRLLHNQTPGGVWGTSYTRWGPQYGEYKAEFIKRRGWKWNSARRKYEQRVIFVNRLNIHYLLYAQKKKAHIWGFKSKGLCRQWIKEHAALYFTNLAAVPTTTD